MAPSATLALTEDGKISRSSSENDSPCDPAAAKEKIASQGIKTTTPLEAISYGGPVISGIPKFSSFAEHRRHILIHMAAVFRDWNMQGFVEGMSGHISVRDPEHPNAIWMNPLGKHFGLMTAGDMICLDMHTGAVIGGNRESCANTAGFHIHTAIHKARRDVHSVCHAHTEAGKAWSAFARPLDMLNQDITLLYNAIAVYADYGGIVFADEEGRRIAASLGPDKKAAILLQHGLLTVGSTVDEAAFLFGLMDRSCRIQLQVEAACAGSPDLKKILITDTEAAFNYNMTSEKHSLYAEEQPAIEYAIAMAGGIEKVAAGVESQKIDL